MTLALTPTFSIQSFNPQTFIDAFHEVSSIWAQKYINRYATALSGNGIYFKEDALAEATYVGAIMDRLYLVPFLINNTTAYPTFGALQSAIEKYRTKVPEPAIFVLGSGNTALPLIMNILIGILTGQHVYFRASAGNVSAVRIWIESLTDQDLMNNPMLVSKHLDHVLLTVQHNIEEITTSHSNLNYAVELSNLPVQKSYLWGGGEAIDNTISMLKPRNQNYLFGPRTGVLVLEYQWWATQSTTNKKLIAQAIYDNIIVNDTALCSSPTRGIIIGSMDEAQQILHEIVELISPSPSEKERLTRSNLGEATSARISMLQWVKFGYKLFAPKTSLIKLALGDTVSFQKKNEYVQNTANYHASAGSLELISFNSNKLDMAAYMIAHLQDESRYKGLWSVGHLITAMSPKSIEQLTNHIENCLKTEPLCSNKRIMPVQELRIVDVRNNLGRAPGCKFDGICLARSMLS